MLLECLICDLYVQNSFASGDIETWERELKIVPAPRADQPRPVFQVLQNEGLGGAKSERGN